MSHTDDAVRSILAASGQILDTGPILAGCVTQIDSAIGLLVQASDTKYEDLIGKIRGLLDEINLVQIHVRGVAQDVASATGRL